MDLISIPRTAQVDVDRAQLDPLLRSSKLSLPVDLVEDPTSARLLAWLQRHIGAEGAATKETLQIDRGAKLSLDGLAYHLARGSTAIAPAVAEAFLRKCFFLACGTSDVPGSQFQYWRLAQLATELLQTLERSVAEISVRQPELAQELSSSAACIAPVGDLHEAGKVTLRLSLGGEVLYLKHRAANVRVWLSDLIAKTGLDHVFLPEWDVYSDFVLEPEIKTGPCRSDVLHQAVASLEALTHALNLDDIHHENFILDSRGLHIIDFESFLMPQGLFGDISDSLKAGSVYGNNFSPHRFKGNQLRGLHQTFQAETEPVGVRHLDQHLSIDRALCEAIVDRSRTVMAAVDADDLRHAALKLRYIAEHTRRYIEDVHAYAGVTEDDESLYQLFLSKMDARAFHVALNAADKHDPDFNLYCAVSCLCGHVPTFWHNGITDQIFADPAGEPQHFAFSGISGYRDLEYRLANFDQNRDFNIRLLYFVYNRRAL